MHCAMAELLDKVVSAFLVRHLLLTDENLMCWHFCDQVFYIILHRKIITVSNMKISDLTVCEPSIKTQCLTFFFFLARTKSWTCADSCVCNYLP